jgi:formate hydrogenlyase subunit 3/multisubunit Na+/H+ antiporter MnhD subunit
MNPLFALAEPAAGWLVVAAVAVPVLAALAAVFVTRRGLAVAGVVAAAPVLALGLAAPTPGVEVRVDWLLLGARFGIDAHTAPFALLTGALWAAASIACAGYFDAPARRRIAPWWLLSLAGSVGLVLALDAITYFVFFAVMSFASYGLVVHRGDAEAFRAGRIYIGYVVAGEVALFSGLVLAARHPGASAALLLAGFGIKAGALLLHSWLPLAHGAAPAPASAVLSGAMLKARLLGWLRFFDSDVPWAEAAGLGLIALGIAGAFAGALIGITQRRPKVVLAYSSVSQMGIAVAAFGMLLAGDAHAGALACALFAVHHALAKGALFIGVGALERLSGNARRAGLALMAVPALALVGAPFTSGAMAKGQVKALAANLPEPWAGMLGWALPLASVGTALLMLRLFATLAAPRDRRPAAALWVPAVVLAVSGVALAAAIPVPAASLAGAGQALGPAAAAVCLVVAWRWLATVSGLRAAEIPAGDLVAVAQRAVASRGHRALERGAVADMRAAVAPVAEVLPCLERAEHRLGGPATTAAVTAAAGIVLAMILAGSA